MTRNTHNIRLYDELQTVLQDTERLLNDTAAVGGEAASDVVNRIGERLGKVRLALAESQGHLIESTRAACKATDVYVHDNPWRSIGIAAAVGFFAGLLAKCR